MDFNKLRRSAEKLVEKRGGTDALKEDLAELKDIAKGKESLGEKAKEAAAALKDPGAKGGERPATTPVPDPDPPAAA